MLIRLITVAGLAAVGLLEAWRPGFVSGAVNLGLMWVAATGLLLVSGYDSSPRQGQE